MGVFSMFFIFSPQFSIKLPQTDSFPALFHSALGCSCSGHCSYLPAAVERCDQQLQCGVYSLILPFLGQLRAKKSLVPPTRVFVWILGLFLSVAVGFAKRRGIAGGRSLPYGEGGVSFIPPHAEFPNSSPVLNFWWKFMKTGVPAPVSAFQYLLPISQLNAANIPPPIPEPGVGLQRLPCLVNPALPRLILLPRSQSFKFISLLKAEAWPLPLVKFCC